MGFLTLGAPCSGVLSILDSQVWEYAIGICGLGLRG